MEVSYSHGELEYATSPMREMSPSSPLFQQMQEINALYNVEKGISPRINEVIPRAETVLSNERLRDGVKSCCFGDMYLGYPRSSRNIAAPAERTG